MKGKYDDNSGTSIVAEIRGGIFVLALFLLGFIFWIWLLVDCANHEQEGSAKVSWLLIILFVNVIGASLYFFLWKLPRQRQAQYHPPPELHQPWRQK